MKTNFTLMVDYNETFILKIDCILRPNLNEVLEYLCSNYEIGVFTAGEQIYADAILNEIDPIGEYFSFRLYRQHCLRRENYLVKDLRIISNRDLSQVVLVDNSILSMAF